MIQLMHTRAAWAGVTCQAAFLLMFVAGSTGYSAVQARKGMAVSADSNASSAAVEVMRSGGNAIDGAVALGFALAVTYPEAGNIGGGGFMVVRTSSGSSAVVDFRETAPHRATKTMFLDSHGNPVAHLSTRGGLSVGVPGSVHGLLSALERYGTKPKSVVLAPAIRLAEQGFVVDDRLAGSIREAILNSHPTSEERTAFTKHGVPLKPGDTLRQPALARTLTRIAEQGSKGFYEGNVASSIVESSRLSGGILSAEDLRGYTSVVRPALQGSYRGYTILTAPPPSAGGLILFEILNTLERLPVSTWGRDSSLTWHYFCSAAQQAYADRSRYAGDPASVYVPVDSLLSKSYGARIASSISPVRRRASLEFGPAVFGNEQHLETTHYCVVDSSGNAVSVTTTLNGLYGSRVYVAGAGFYLNNEMDDFVVKPGLPNMFGLTGGDANSINPDRRMVSSMTPVIVMNGNRPWILTGARGGSRIPTAVTQILMNVIDFKMSLPAAIEAPRIHHQWLPDEIAIEPVPPVPGVRRGLEALGYSFRQNGEQNARAEGLVIDPVTGIIVAAPDPREGGVGVGF
jgi:gamma-glutamyltranspeptidase/glutathione hydrolase